MDVISRIERSFDRCDRPGGNSGLSTPAGGSDALCGVPAGARVRPRLCHSVAAACGEDHPAATEAAGAALELLHCASLVHDDLPCFDAAETRRGRPSVHKAFGEPLAVLTGDALIVLAFQTLARIQGSAGAARRAHARPSRNRSACPRASSPGRPGNASRRSILRTITAPRPARCLPRRRSQAQRRPAPTPSRGAWWARSSARPIRSPTIFAMRPATKTRSASRSDAILRWAVPARCVELGLDGALYRLHELVRGAIDAMPPCPNGAELRALMLSEAKRLVPAKLAQFAA